MQEISSIYVRIGHDEIAESFNLRVEYPLGQIAIMITLEQVWHAVTLDGATKTPQRQRKGSTDFVNSISTDSRQKAVYEWRVLTIHKSAGEDVVLGIFGAFLGKGPVQLLPQTHLPCRCALVAMVR